MKKGFLALCLLLTACTPGGNPPPAQTGSNAQTSQLTQVLSPICADTLRDQNVIPQEARNFGIDEAAVCRCGIARTETKLRANPGQIVDLLLNQDAQIRFLVELGQECSVQLLQEALSGQNRPAARN
ncbi:MAG: hypothetical protein IGS03_16250 [Candidatus Sericytochromatia bacterium]|nr:hypothetical protein [Candidatus Sericytochromatia bacterium]